MKLLTDAKAFPKASPVCELPAAFPLLTAKKKGGGTQSANVMLQVIGPVSHRVRLLCQGDPWTEQRDSQAKSKQRAGLTQEPPFSAQAFSEGTDLTHGWRPCFSWVYRVKAQPCPEPACLCCQGGAEGRRSLGEGSHRRAGACQGKGRPRSTPCCPGGTGTGGTSSPKRRDPGAFSDLRRHASMGNWGFGPGSPTLTLQPLHHTGYCNREPMNG